ncbi:MAG: VirB3 family type IV secretion system protein [Novosphingobium sp.]
MSGLSSIAAGGEVEGFEVPLHRALTEPILLGGAPRGIAILNGTLAAAMGLGLQQWIAGLLLWLAGHSLAVFAAKRDPDFAAVIARHLRQKVYLTC